MVTEQLSEQAAVTDWPLRLLFVGCTLLIIVALLGLLRRGWRGRRRRQGFPPLPPIPAAAEHWPAVAVGSLIGTVERGQLLERVVAAGGRSAVTVRLGADAVLLDAAVPLLLRHDAISSVTTSPGMLQRHFGGHGLVMIDWNWDARAVTTGLWFADAADQARVLAALSAMTVEGAA